MTCCSSVRYQTSVCLLLYAPLLWRLEAILITDNNPQLDILGNKKHFISLKRVHCVCISCSTSVRLQSNSCCSILSLTSQVNVSENPSTGEVTVRHLSSHLAATEEVAQSLLFQGSTCRRVAETAMNQCSSRSHSIFTITLTTKTQGAEVVTK